MKYRIKHVIDEHLAIEIEDGKRPIQTTDFDWYYPQYKFFIFWHYFRDSGISIEHFLSKKEAKQYIESKSKNHTLVEVNYINYE